ncbi:MAG: hypothetical protein VX543_00710 [Cyanobacteriota bacterium]|nr:hypothetical protein [Cyanobacteriota bacterium]
MSRPGQRPMPNSDKMQLLENRKQRRSGATSLKIVLLAMPYLKQGGST